MFTSAPEALRVGSGGDEGLDGCDDVGFVLRVGDAEPRVVGLEHGDVGFARLDEVVDDLGGVAFGLAVGAVVFEEADAPTISVCGVRLELSGDGLICRGLLLIVQVVWLQVNKNSLALQHTEACGHMVLEVDAGVGVRHDALA